MGQHALAAARSRQIADDVEDLAQVYLGLALALGKLRQDGPDPFPFCVGQAGRVAPPLKDLLALAMVFRLQPAHVGLTLGLPNLVRHSQCGKV